MKFKMTDYEPRTSLWEVSHRIKQRIFGTRYKVGTDFAYKLILNIFLRGVCFMKKKLSLIVLTLFSLLLFTLPALADSKPASSNMPGMNV